MEDAVWRPAELTSEQMEERRLAAARLLRQGRLSQAEIARQLGVSRASVCRWAATLAQRGRRGLKARPIPGRLPRLDEKAWGRLGRLLDRGAVAAGFATERWTLALDGRFQLLLSDEADRRFALGLDQSFALRRNLALGLDLALEDEGGDAQAEGLTSLRLYF